MKTKKVFTILILAAICLIFITLGAQAIDYPQIEGSVPGTTLEGYVRYIYLFALSIVGIAALGAITFGGITYMLSDTITSKDEAKKWIWGAISGLILALAAYLILYTINPDLVSLKGLTLPSTETTSSPTPSPASGDICQFYSHDADTGQVLYECVSSGQTFTGMGGPAAEAHCEAFCP